MISYIFFFIAAFINGITDTLCFNFSESKFKKLNPSFWNPWVSFNFVPTTLGFVKLDAFHWFKYLMIFSLAVSLKYYSPIFSNLWGIIDIFVMMIIWGIGFEISRKIFKNK